MLKETGALGLLLRGVMEYLRRDTLTPRPPALNKSNYVEPLFTTRRAVPGRVVGEQPLPSVCFKILKAETTIVYHH